MERPELSVHKRKWCFFRTAEFLGSQILKQPPASSSDHYRAPESPITQTEEGVQEELPLEMLGDRPTLPPHVAWDDNRYYQHTSERMSFYTIPEPTVVHEHSWDESGNYHDPALRTEK